MDAPGPAAEEKPVTDPTVLGSTLKQAQVPLGGCGAPPLPAVLRAPHLRPLPRPIGHLPPTFPQMAPQRARVRACARACVCVCVWEQSPQSCH